MPESKFSIPDDWTFKSFDVASHFDQHVREQLPWYELVVDSIVTIARHYLGTCGIVYDIGCSTGNVTRAISNSVASRNPRFIGIDNSSYMGDFYPKEIGEFVLADACDYQYAPFDVAVCYLCLQFIPLDKRRGLIAALTKNVKKSGAIIIIDKFIVTGQYCFVRDIFRRITLNFKRSSGASSDDIIQKELSICGVQRPVSLKLIKDASPLAFEFFRFGEFSGWVIPGSNE